MTAASSASVDPAPEQRSRPADARGEGVLGRSYRALTLGIVAVVILLAFEATAVNTAMPVAARQLHGLGLYAFAFSGYFTGMLFALVVSGQWCDRRRPVAPLFSGIAVFGAGLVVAGTAPDMVVFIAGRAVQGLGTGLVIVAVYVVVGRAYPARLRPAVFAAISAAWIAPSILGPVVSGTVTQNLGWRWVFLTILVLILPPLVVMWPALRRSEAARAGERQQAGPYRRSRTVYAAMAALGAGLLQYAGQRLDVAGLLPALAGAALLGPAVVRLLPRGTLRLGRGLPTVILLRGVAAGAFFAAEPFIPLMMVTQRGLSPTLAGLTLTGGGLCWALGAWLQGRPAADPHRERLIRLGIVLMATAIAGAGLVLIPAVPAWAAAAAWAVGGIGLGLVVASLSVLMMKMSAPEETGANSAAIQLSDALGNVLLIGLAGVLFAAVSGGSVSAVQDAQAPTAAFGVIFAVLTGVALFGALVAGRVRRR